MTRDVDNWAVRLADRLDAVPMEFGVALVIALVVLACLKV